MFRLIGGCGGMFHAWGLCSVTEDSAHLSHALVLRGTLLFCSFPQHTMVGVHCVMGCALCSPTRVALCRIIG